MTVKVWAEDETESQGGGQEEEEEERECTYHNCSTVADSRHRGSQKASDSSRPCFHQRCCDKSSKFEVTAPKASYRIKNNFYIENLRSQS